MALKFRPVVVTAVLISVIELDPLFSVKKNMGLRDSYARVARASLEFCSHEQSSLSDGCCFIKCQLFMSLGFTFGTAG